MLAMKNSEENPQTVCDNSSTKIHVEYVPGIQEAGKKNLYLQGNNGMRGFQT